MKLWTSRKHTICISQKKSKTIRLFFHEISSCLAIPDCLKPLFPRKDCTFHAQNLFFWKGYMFCIVHKDFKHRKVSTQVRLWQAYSNNIICCLLMGNYPAAGLMTLKAACRIQVGENQTMSIGSTV